ncbi:MAG: hypothetical protein KA116_06175 [Proteobacteria bacterium]|nr:hypothetical protein [Pseudomonadota bacterium]
MKIKKTKLKFGFTLVQVVVALGLAGILGMLIFRFSSDMLTSGKRMVDSSTQAQLQAITAPITKDIPGWVAKMIAQYPSLQTCIPLNPPTGFTYSCPAVAGTIDPDVNAKFPGKTIVTLKMVDILGREFAGTEATPVDYDSRGEICTNNCRFHVVGYMVRDNAAGDPGNIVFAYRITSIDSVQAGFSFKKVIKEIPINSHWVDVKDECPIGTYLYGINPDRTPKCQIGGKALANQGCLAPGQYLKGFNSSGAPVCASLSTSIVQAQAPWVLNSGNGFYYATAVATCPPTHLRTGGGAVCQANTGPIVPLFDSNPAGTLAWQGACYNNAAPANPTDIGIIVYAVCMQIN